MARKYSKSWTARWDDPDFLALTGSQQALYGALSDHQDISWCGVLPFVPARFVALAADYTEAKIRGMLRVLVRERFLIADPKTAELCVRTFIKHDEVLKVPNVAKAMGRAFFQVHSPLIQDAIVAELARLLASDPKLPGWGALRGSYPDLINLIEANGSGNPSAKGSAKGSGNRSANGSRNTPQPLNPSTLKTPVAELGMAFVTNPTRETATGAMP